MPRGKNCREAIFAAQLPHNYPHHGGNFERGKNVLYCGGEAIWEAFYETILARVIESQKSPRDSVETISAARHQDVSRGPLGGKFSPNVCSQINYAGKSYIKLFVEMPRLEGNWGNK